MRLNETSSELVPTPTGILLVRRPVAEPVGCVVLTHGLGENRTGNNYLFSTIAIRMAEHGLAAVTYDLSGFGDSLGPPDVDHWSRQAETARQHLAEAFPGRPLHWVARGAAAALLPAHWSQGARVAISPPTADELR